MSAAPIDAPFGLIGTSPAIRKVRSLIERVGASRSPVLLLGESGTGKEVVARALHSVNPQGTFVPIDCGSLVGPLLESELFGHTKGSFTGASENKKGLIELANNGTAFFDEIGDLPLELQVKLLRLLQEREYRPVGSLARHKVEIRVIAATHRDLAREVERNNFRQDLFYRLNVITIRLPPLRDRREDIPLLIEGFLARKQPRFTMTPDVFEALNNHDWPGNIRELHNCIDRMTAMAGGSFLQPQDMPTAIQFSRDLALLGDKTSPVSVAEPGSAVRVNRQVIPLAEVERRAILEAMEATKGDRSVAALLLGIGRTTLYRKLRDYQCETL